MLVHGKLTIHDFTELYPDVNKWSRHGDVKSILDKGLIEEKGAGPTAPTPRYVQREL